LMSNASAATYQWIDCATGSEITGETAASFTATANGQYAVAVTQNGCTDTSACMTVANISVEEITWAKGIQLFPNPTNGNVELQFAQSMSSIELVLTNALGQEVQRTTYKNTDHIGMTLNVPAGTYFMEVYAGEGEKITLPLIKQ